jgi:hypothetical protein
MILKEILDEGGKKPPHAITTMKVDARNMDIYICLQFNELFSHLPVPVLLRQSMLPTLSGSTSEHRGSHKHRGFEHHGYNDSIDLHRHRGLERRGSNKHPGFENRGSNKYHLEHRRSHKHHGFTEHRGSTQFHTQHRVATRAKLQYTRHAYALSSTSHSHLILISLLSMSPVPIAPEKNRRSF